MEVLTSDSNSTSLSNGSYQNIPDIRIKKYKKGLMMAHININKLVTYFTIKARRDRNDDHQGGGCLIYVHDDIKDITTTKDDLERNYTEATYIEIRFKYNKP